MIVSDLKQSWFFCCLNNSCKCHARLSFVEEKRHQPLIKSLYIGAICNQWTIRRKPWVLEMFSISTAAQWSWILLCSLGTIHLPGILHFGDTQPYVRFCVSTFSWKPCLLFNPLVYHSRGLTFLFSIISGGQSLCSNILRVCGRNSIWGRVVDPFEKIHSKWPNWSVSLF